MNARSRATPCIGICSTTYGDLVCRGCKRFAHEIVGWNGYTETQRERVRERLQALKLAAVRSSLELSDPALFARCVEQLDGPDLPLEALIIWLLERVDPTRALQDVGLRPIDEADLPRIGDARRHLDQVDSDLARAFYERSFRVSVQS